MASRSVSPEAPGRERQEDSASDNPPVQNGAVDMSDDDSDLSDVDEAQFQDFDVANITVQEREPIHVDETNVGLLGSHKRKRVPGEEGATKRKKEGKRSKKPKPTAPASDDDLSGGDGDYDGDRERRRKAGRSARAARGPTEGGAERARKARAATPDEELTPEQRRKRALDRAMDEAIRGQKVRRSKKDGEDLQALADEEIEAMRNAMMMAAKADQDARIDGKPAMHKLKLLPQVTSLLARSNLRDSFVDPETNFLECVRFFLEPLEDGSLPAFNIQKDLFAALQTLPIDKDALIASGIGRVALFYTKSKRPEPSIKRIAEQLIADWSRPILLRPDDYRQKVYEARDYDPSALPHRPSQGNPSALSSQSQLSEAERRERILPSPMINPNRARLPEARSSYTIVPKSVVKTSAGPHAFARPLGASGDDQFRRMKARQQAARK